MNIFMMNLYFKHSLTKVQVDSFSLNDSWFGYGNLTELNRFA